MHSKGKPCLMQKNPRYECLISEITEYFSLAIKKCLDERISRKQLVIDPGIGFGKTLEHNLVILKNLYAFKALGLPILLGPSRKSFIAKVINTDVNERLAGTLAACVLARNSGVNFFRVHDVKEVKRALKIADAIILAKAG